MTALFVFTFTFFCSFFLIDLFVRRLFDKLHERIKEYNYTYLGIILAGIGLISTVFRLVFSSSVTEFSYLLSVAFYGSGFGIIVHHTLYKGFLISQDRELSVAQRYHRQINRGLEILPGFLTYFVLLSPILLALSLPAVLVWLVIAANVYWFFKAMRIALFVIVGYRKMRQAESVDWLQKLEQEHPEDNRIKVQKLAEDLTKINGQYIRGNLLISLICGITIFVGLVLIDVPYAAPLALFAALVDMLPQIGAVIGATPAVIIAFAVNPTAGVLTLLLFIIYQQIENNILSPNIYNKALNLSPALSFIAVLVGGSLAGIVGAFIALPIAASIPTIINYVKDNQINKTA